MKNKGFTLVELLVVIMIIGVLASILMPAVGAAFKKSKMASANSEVRGLETAVKAYLQEYGKFPLQFEAKDRTYPGNEYRDLVAILRGINVDNKWNMKNILFLEVGEDSIKNGALQDPWEGEYVVAADWSFNNIVNVNPAVMKLAVTGRNVIVWSTNNTDIATWK